MPGFPVLTLLGAVAMLAILVTTYFTNVFKMTLVFGVPFLLILAALYFLLFKKRGETVMLQTRSQRG
jgi:L-asparagine transporter-like permease